MAGVKAGDANGHTGIRGEDMCWEVDYVLGKSSRGFQDFEEANTSLYYQFPFATARDHVMLSFRGPTPWVNEE